MFKVFIITLDIILYLYIKITFGLVFPRYCFVQQLKCQNCTSQTRHLNMQLVGAKQNLKLSFLALLIALTFCIFQKYLIITIKYFYSLKINYFTFKSFLLLVGHHIIEVMTIIVIVAAS